MGPTNPQMSSPVPSAVDTLAAIDDNKLYKARTKARKTQEIKEAKSAQAKVAKAPSPWFCELCCDTHPAKASACLVHGWPKNMCNAGNVLPGHSCAPSPEPHDYDNGGLDEEAALRLVIQASHASLSMRWLCLKCGFDNTESPYQCSRCKAPYESNAPCPASAARGPKPPYNNEGQRIVTAQYVPAERW